MTTKQTSTINSLDKLTVFIDGNTKPLPHHGFWVLETGHLCVFVEYRILDSNDLEWEALKAFLHDERFAKVGHITINSDHSSVVTVVNALRKGDLEPDDMKAEGQIFNSKVVRLAKPIIKLMEGRNITLKQIWGHDNQADKLLRNAIKQNYNLPTRWVHEEIHKPVGVT